MSLRDTLATARLAVQLRRIWNGAATITPARLTETVAVLYKYFTGKDLPK